VDYVLKITQGPGETVNSCDYQPVALAQELKQRYQFLAPLGAGAGYLLRSDYGVYPSKSIIALTCTLGQALDFVSVGGAAACPTIVARQGAPRWRSWGNTRRAGNVEHQRQLPCRRTYSVSF
jgi:hypothetical protein